MRHHPVFTLDELRSGKIPDISVCEQKLCPKHKGESLLFYCETCDIPICRQCVVIAHRHPEHQQAELEQAATERSAKLQQLREACQKKKETLDEGLKEVRSSRRDFDQAVSEVKSKIKNTVEKVKSSYLKRLDEAKKAVKDELSNLETNKVEMLKTAESRMISANARLSNAVKLTKQLIDDGSELEIASDYLNLKGVMEKLNDTATSADIKASKGIGELIFTENKVHEEKISLGHLRYLGNRQISHQEDLDLEVKIRKCGKREAQHSNRRCRDPTR